MNLFNYFNTTPQTHWQRLCDNLTSDQIHHQPCVIWLAPMFRHSAHELCDIDSNIACNIIIIPTGSLVSDCIKTWQVAPDHTCGSAFGVLTKNIKFDAMINLGIYYT